MKNKSTPFLFFTMLVFLMFLTGCTQIKDSSDTSLSINETVLAIGIALNNSSVRADLTGPWMIIGVNFNATTTFSGGREDVKIHTPDVTIDTESRIVHVYVDLDNQSVVHIWDQPKRPPMPVKTQED